MPHCPSCSAALPADQAFCGACGARVSKPAPADSATHLDSPPGPESESPTTSDPASISAEHRFLPGTVLDGRYRIVGPLGRGGMGEVYRADDLKLGQSVALKFLPEELEHDAPRKNLLLSEVRLARQVSHPNVCRVYDIGELDGLPFISMEYVDGENLASLLRRIGRLPAEKGLETARQICAGLAAAHEQGIVHRDLKPANVMIDGRGRVKITDFGLAGLAGGIGEREVRAGTPAYMAPEQLAGHEATFRSDIYALGLVLYELVTGKQAFAGKSVAEIVRRQQSTQPTSPSSIVSDMDEATERVILRCLEKDPQQRPRSALSVSAALPGGDPLAAALAAGETPSPELVAEAGSAGGLHPAWAVAFLAAALVTLVIVTLFSDRIDEYAPLELSAEELTAKARDALAELGHTELPPSRKRGFDLDWDYLRWVSDNVERPNRWEILSEARPPAVNFWYRYSDERLTPVDVHAYRVTDQDPPLNEPGSGMIRLDRLGRLAGFVARPADLGRPDAEPFDWSLPFTLAEMSLDEFEETPPVKPAPCPTTELRAWKRAGEEGEDETIVQAGTVGDRLTYYEVIGAWNPVESEDDDSSSGPGFIVGFIIALILSATVYLAYRNLKVGRSDTKGAFRLAMFTIISMQLAMTLNDVQLSTLDLGAIFQGLVFGRPLGHALLHAALAWVLYIALEPYVRRLWPRTLVSWTRLLRGRLRDPLLGRDILVGFAAGLVMVSIPRIGAMLALSPHRQPMPNTGMLGNGGDLGLRDTLADLATISQIAVYIPLGFMAALLLLRLLLRRDWIAIAAVSAMLGVMPAINNPALAGLEERVLAVVLGMGFVLLLAIVLTRVGLVAAITMFSTGAFSGSLPLTFDMTRWYAGSSLLALTAYAALAAWAFYISLAGRPVFKDTLATPD